MLSRDLSSGLTRCLALLLVLLQLVPVTLAAAEGGDEKGGDMFGGLPLLVQLILLLILIGLSAVFCGLTLGIMGLDSITLEIVADAGNEPDRSFAAELLPIRKLGHQALSTLILGNMGCNVLIAQLVSDITPPGEQAVLVSFVVATLVILIFAEVVPMSVCRGPKALQIASAGVPILRAFLVILYPIAKPLGILLDKITPHDVGQIYDRNELKKLMHVHCEKHGDVSGLDVTELKLLIGAMEFHEEIVGNVMTPLAKVFSLPESTEVDHSLVEVLWKEGKSRVPVHADYDTNRIIGVLFVKDLVSLLATRESQQAAHETITVGQLVSGNARDLVRVRYSTTLPTALRMFQSYAPHLFLVEEDSATQDVFCGRFVGIVTLEDVIEKLIKSDIRDEYDAVESDDDREVEVNVEDDTYNAEVALAIPADFPSQFGGTRESTGKAAPAATVKIATPTSAALKTPVVPVAPQQHHHAVRRIHVEKVPKRLPRVNMWSFFCTGGPLTSDQRWVLADYLQNSFVAFAGWRVNHIKLLLDEVGDHEYTVSSSDFPPSLQRDGSSLEMVLGEDQAGVASTLRHRIDHAGVAKRVRPDLVLYRYDEPSNVFTIVLNGGVRLFVGECLFSSEGRSFTALGESALEFVSVENKSSLVVPNAPVGSPVLPRTSTQKNFTPDFTAVVSRNSRILQITLKDYLRVDSYFRKAPPAAHDQQRTRMTQMSCSSFANLRDIPSEDARNNCREEMMS